MIVSEARLNANRQNALRSTGPKTPEGKARSRANALKHGLCSTVVVPEDLAQVQDRTDAWFYALMPQDDFQSWLVGKIAIASIRLDRAERMERRVREKIALRAELTWDDDRRLEVEILGGSLAKKPAETVQALRRTPQGCDWMMTRWAMLAHSADKNQGWNEAQTQLAYDLLATPSVFRDGNQPGLSLGLDGRVAEEDYDPAGVARREVAELKAQREVVADLDEVERALAESDMTNDSDPELRRLRRYESDLYRRVQWCLKQLHFESPNKAPYPGLRTQWVVEPEPAPKPEPKSKDEIAAENHPPNAIHPPFCIEPDEAPDPGQDVDIPAILKSRKEKKRARAEAQRQGRRRKLDQLRG